MLPTGGALVLASTACAQLSGQVACGYVENNSEEFNLTALPSRGIAILPRSRCK